MKLHKFLLAGVAAASFAMAAVPSSADVVILDFNDGTAFDDIDGGLPLPATFTSTNDDGETVVTTAISAFSPNLTTGDLEAASIGIRSNALGVDNLGGGNGSEAGDFSNGEILTLEFDRDVIIDNFDIASIDAGSTLTITVNGLTAVADENTPDGELVNAFNGAVIPAGSDITFTAASAAGQGLRITDITVSIVAVPEPSSLALLSLGGLMIVGRRRRA